MGKAKLSLLSGKRTTDLKSLAKLYEKLAGRKPTAEELAQAKELLAKK